MSTFLWSTPRIVLTRHERPTASKTSDLRKALSLVNKKISWTLTLKDWRCYLWEGFSWNKCNWPFLWNQGESIGGSWITKGKERLALNYSWRKKMKTSWRTNWQNLAATTIHQFYMVTASFCPRIRSLTDYVFLPWKEFVYLRGPQAVRLIDVSLIMWSSL